MSIFYGVSCLLSLIMLVAYFFVDKGREKWLMLLFISISVCNIGYFMFSLSKCLTMALIGNSIAYIGNVLLPFFMLMLIIDVCDIQYKKALMYVLLGLGILMLFISTSGGYLPIYYKSVNFEIVQGGARLIKEYGPLHILYYIYLFAYMVSMVATIIYSIIKQKIKSKMHAIFLSVIVLGNIFVWLTEQFVKHDFEFLCILYIIDEGLLLFLYGMLREYKILHIASAKKELTQESVMQKEYLTEKQIENLNTLWVDIQTLTGREKDTLKYTLMGKQRKEIAELLYISDNTVKKHLANIYDKLYVSGKKELIEKAKSLVK